MTSRDRPHRRSTDLLDVMIRWVLRESVGDATPPPAVWKRINERLVRRAGAEGAAWLQGFRLIAEGVAVWLLEPGVGLPTELPHRRLAAEGAWEEESLWWADQYGILLRRLAVL